MAIHVDLESGEAILQFLLQRDHVASTRSTAKAPSDPLGALMRGMAQLQSAMSQTPSSKEREPELVKRIRHWCGGGQRLFVLAVEVGGRWNDDSQALVRQLVRVRALRAPPALRAAASSAWTRRWWGMLSAAVQHAVGCTALGAPWLVSKGAAGCEPALDHVLALAEPAGPSRLPLR